MMPIRKILSDALKDFVELSGETGITIALHLIPLLLGLASVAYLTFKIARALLSQPPIGRSALMKGLLSREIRLGDVLSKGTASAALGLLVLVVAFAFSLMSAAYRNGQELVRQQILSNAPQATIELNGKPLEGQTIMAAKPSQSFIMRLDIQSNIDLPRPYVVISSSRYLGIGGDISEWRTNPPKPGFEDTAQWGGNAPIYKEQPWPVPIIQGFLLTGNLTGKEVPTPANIRVEAFVGGPNSPVVANFVVVPAQ
jgi:hypothetical protein